MTGRIGSNEGAPGLGNQSVPLGAVATLQYELEQPTI